MNARCVLHCIPGMGGGGAERQLVYLAGGLCCLGWDVHVALVSGGPNWPDLLSSGATVHHIDVANNHDPRLIVELARIVGRVRPDLMQVWMRPMEVVGGLIGSIRRIPWILSERSCGPAYARTFKTRVRVLSAFGASAVVSNSVGGDLYWKSRLGTRVPRYIVPNALPLERIAAASPADSRELDIPEGRQIILFAGRFSPEKEVATLVRALTRVLAVHEVVAVLAGDGPLGDSVRALVEREAIASHVRIPGYLDNIWGWMKRAAVLAAPSSFEGHPNSVLEAMASGCPVIASDIDAHRAFLDDSTAVLVPPGNPDRLASALIDLLAEPGSAAVRAKRALASSQQWAVENVAGAYAHVYDEVLRKRANQRRHPR